MSSKPSNQGYINASQNKFNSAKNEYNSYNSNDDHGRLNMNDTEFGQDEANEKENFSNNQNKNK